MQFVLLRGKIQLEEVKILYEINYEINHCYVNINYGNKLLL